MDAMTDPLDAELARALAVDPSPQFVARVRMRIADERSAASAGVRWMFAALAFAAAVIVAVVMVRPAPQTPPRQSETLLPSQAIERALVVPTVIRTKTGHDARTVARGPAANVPAILVDPREARAMRAFLDGTRTGGIEPALVAQSPASPIMEPTPIREILITPIRFGSTDGSRDKGVER